MELLLTLLAYASVLGFLISFVAVILFVKNFIMLLIKNWRDKKSDKVYNNKSESVDNHQRVNAYKLYLSWCKRSNLIPVSEVKYNSLANEKGSINIADMMALHPEFQLATQATDDYEAKKLKEEGRKKRNQDFVNSTAMGYITDSTFIGTLLGGSLLGGMLGSHLSKKKKKK